MDDLPHWTFYQNVRIQLISKSWIPSKITNEPLGWFFSRSTKVTTDHDRFWPSIHNSVYLWSPVLIAYCTNHTVTEVRTPNGQDLTGLKSVPIISVPRIKSGLGFSTTDRTKNRTDSSVVCWKNDNLLIYFTVLKTHCPKSIFMCLALER